MNVTHHETAEFLWRKKVKAINLITETPAVPSVVLLQPQGQQQFVVLNAFATTRNISGAVSAARISLDDGGAGAIVAAVAPSATEKGVVALTVLPGIVIDATHPLTLDKVTVAQTGTLKLEVDVVVTLVALHDIA